MLFDNIKTIMRHKTILKEGMHRGFRKGVDAVPLGKQKDLKTALTAIIGGKTHCKLFYYVNGKTVIQPKVAKKIEKVFIRFDISPSDIWDE